MADTGRERVFLAEPIPAGRGRIVATPFQFLVTGEDHLRVRSWCGLAGVTLTVSMRFAALDGTIIANQEFHAPASNRTLVSSTIALTAGYVVNLVVRASSGAPLIGQCYVLVDVIRGLGANAIVLGEMLAGYVTAGQGVAWPGSPIESSISGGGYYRIVVGTTPAAGNGIAETVPTGARWELISVQTTLTTSAAAGAREAALYLDDGATIHLFSDAAATVGPTSVLSYAWFHGSPHTTSATLRHAQQSLPRQALLLAGHRFRIDALAIDIADQFTEPRFSVREWLEAAA